MNRNDSVINTQQSSNFFPEYSAKRKIGMHESMFRKDFCMHFSISLSQESGHHRKFYKIKAEGKKLENLLEYDNHNFLEYEFDKILATNMVDILDYGKAYVEIVRWYDEELNLVGLSLKPFRNTRQIHWNHKFYFRLKTINGQVIKGRIDDEDVIVFSAKELGYSKRYFRKLCRKMKRFEITNLQLSLDSNSGFDFDVYKKREEFELLKVGRDVCWLGRNFNNYYINEPYLLYLKIQELTLKTKLLNVLLNKYNQKLCELGKKYDFEGQIYFESKAKENEMLFNELMQGVKNCKEVSDELYRIS